MSDEEENDEEIVLNDELFRRIIASAKDKQRYSYRLSFQDEVGSSLDPDMEDVAEWERILQGVVLTTVSPRDNADLTRPSSLRIDEEEIAERAAQAEEAALWAILDGADTVLGSSDIDDINPKFQVIPDEDPHNV
ncbi:hypothetical protein BJV77DRAFT_1067801 [Russula vinacea]|nr:hypothetical protein BJV77DRAFT_1067801 [Russula vinacea]